MAKDRTLTSWAIALPAGPAKAWFGALAARRPVTLAWIAATAYASCAMLVFINSRSIWLDESISIAIASAPFGQMTAILRHVDAVHAFYYSMLHLWLYLGHGAIVVRLLSAVFALLASIEIATLGALMFGEVTAPAVVAVLATSVFFLFYADEARPTALSLLTCSLTALRFWRIVSGARPHDIFLCVLFAVLSIYADAVSIVFLAGLAASLGFMRLERRTIIRLTRTAVAGCVAVIPLAALIRANSLAQISWIARSSPREVVEFGLSILGASGSGRFAHVLGLLAAATVSGLIVLGAVGGWRSGQPRASVLAASTWLVVPFVLAVGIDRLIHPILVARYFVFALIPIAVLAGNGLVMIGRVLRPRVACALVAGLGLISIFTLATLQPEDWRSVAQLVLSSERAGDGIVFCAPITITPFVFAVHELAQRQRARVAYPTGPLLNDVDYPRPRPGFVAGLSRRYERVWFVDSHDLTPPGEPGPFARLARYYSRAQRHMFPGVEVTLYSR